jgi:hypothetical protein
VKLDHAPGATHETALFLPKSFDPSKPAVLVPYFHGHGGSIPDSFERQKLAELAAKSGKNMAFVIPQLGAKSEITNEFRNPANAAKFLDESASALAKLYVRTHPGANADETAKAFHDMPVVTMTYSGGYQAAWSTLTLPQVKGAVVLDSMYSSAKPFVDFAKRADKPFVSVMYGDSTAGHVKEFQAAAPKENVVVQPNPTDHPTLVQNALGGVFQSIDVSADGVRYAGVNTKQTLAAVSRPTTPAL